MEVQTIPKEGEHHPQFPKHVPFPYLERLVLGAVVGAVGGIVAVWIAFDMVEAAAICAVILAPFFAFVGASCGVISKRHGWGAVRPIAWAIVGGIVLHIDRPIGWVIGGVIGGVINGLLRRSAASTAKGALVGAGLGIIGWTVVWAYLLGLVSVLNHLGGE
jgi:hypothetical protein